MAEEVSNDGAGARKPSFNDMELDEMKIMNMVQYGYPKEYIIKCLQDNLPNYTTAGYYLLKMDQNYC